MRKPALFIALVASAGLAAAQSSVVLFGVVDNNIRHGTGSIADRTQLGSGGNLTSRIGFRGTEDLGGGLSAGFWLEGALTTDDGSGGPTNTNNQTSGVGAAIAGREGITFGRRATVSLLSKSWGELRLGRDYANHYRNRVEFDPFQNTGVGTIQPQSGTLGGLPNTRVSNSVMYFLPGTLLGGLYGGAQVYFGENASNGGTTGDDGDGASFRVGYRAGPFNAAVSSGRTRYATTATAGDIRSTNLGLHYRLGSATLMSGYFIDKVYRTAPITGRGASIGVTFGVPTGEIRAQVSQYGTNAGTKPETRKLALGYVHSLSKRTVVYGTYARVNNSGGATAALNNAVTGANQSSTGWEAGLRHSF